MLWSTVTASTLLDAVASTSVVALLTVISCLRPAIGEHELLDARRPWADPQARGRRREALVSGSQLVLAGRDVFEPEHAGAVRRGRLHNRRCRARDADQLDGRVGEHSARLILNDAPDGGQRLALCPDGARDRKAHDAQEDRADSAAHGSTASDGTRDVIQHLVFEPQV